MSARLIPLGQGDCRDYRTWLLADRGMKDEQTAVDATGMAGVESRFHRAAPSQALRIERRGNVFFPILGDPAA